MIECVLVLRVVVWVVNILLKILFRQRLQVVVFKKLNYFAVGMDLNSGDEYVSFQLSLKRWSYSYYYFDVIVRFEFTLLH